MSYEIKTVINKKNIKQLLDYSQNDPLVEKFTNDKKRFESIDAFFQWRKKGRILYTLVDEKGDLRGIIWFGEKPLPRKKFTSDFPKDFYRITFAVRIYKEARGKGYGLEFMSKAFEEFYKSVFFRKLKRRGFWLEVSCNNLTALRLYKKFGFRKVCKNDKSGKIIMIYPRDKTVGLINI